MSIISQGNFNDTSNKIKNFNNSLTMQKALETAYDDWNKNKNKIDTNTDLNNHQLTSALTSTIDSVILDEETFKKINPLNTEIANKKALVEKEKHSEIISEETVTIITGGCLNNLKSSISTIPYYCGNPTVDTVKGVLHIYKDRFVIM